MNSELIVLRKYNLNKFDRSLAYALERSNIFIAILVMEVVLERRGL